MTRFLRLLKLSCASLATLAVVAGQSLALAPALRGGEPSGPKPLRKPRPQSRFTTNTTPKPAADSLRLVHNAQVKPFFEKASRALTTDRTILARMRRLAARASEGTLTTGARTLFNIEFTAYRTLLDTVAETTTFGDAPMFTGELDVLLEGSRPGVLVFLDLPDATAEGFDLDDESLLSITAASVAINSVDYAVEMLARYRTNLSAAWIQLQ